MLHSFVIWASYWRKKIPSALIRVFGANYEGVYEQGNLRFEGTYQREDIPTMLTEKGVKIVVLPSPSPETFSYIAQECMTLNVHWSALILVHLRSVSANMDTNMALLLQNFLRNRCWLQ